MMGAIRVGRTHCITPAYHAMIISGYDVLLVGSFPSYSFSTCAPRVAIIYILLYYIILYYIMMSRPRPILSRPARRAPQSKGNRRKGALGGRAWPGAGGRRGWICGSSTGQNWSNTSQTVLVKHWSNTGQILAESIAGLDRRWCWGGRLWPISL